MPQNRLDLESLKNGLGESIIASFGAFMSDCAIYSFHSENHTSGVILEVKTNSGKITYEVIWSHSNPASMAKSMNDQNRTIDYAAMCVAILTVLDLTEYTLFETSQTGSGIDFWLAKEGEELDFSKCARLEISGIKEAKGTNTIEYRLNSKKIQIQKSANLGTIAYISITEFHTPTSVFISQ